MILAIAARLDQHRAGQAMAAVQCLERFDGAILGHIGRAGRDRKGRGGAKDMAMRVGGAEGQAGEGICGHSPLVVSRGPSLKCRLVIAVHARGE